MDVLPPMPPTTQDSSSFPCLSVHAIVPTVGHGPLADLSCLQVTDRRVIFSCDVRTGPLADALKVAEEDSEAMSQGEEPVHLSHSEHDMPVPEMPGQEGDHALDLGALMFPGEEPLGEDMDGFGPHVWDHEHLLEENAELFGGPNWHEIDDDGADEDAGPGPVFEWV